MIAVPADTPVTIPEINPTVAIPVAPELQVPPVIASLNVVVVPIQIFVEPLIITGDGLTVIVVVIIQPVGNV